MVRYTIERDGFIDVFDKMGATVLQMLVGPCIGMWDREGADKEERNTIVHSFNRNFSKELINLIRWLCGFARTSYRFSHSRRFKF
jgi:aconitase A